MLKSLSFLFPLTQVVTTITRVLTIKEFLSLCGLVESESALLASGEMWRKGLAARTADAIGLYANMDITQLII